MNINVQKARDRIVPKEEIYNYLRDALPGGQGDLDSKCSLSDAEKAQAVGFASLVFNDLALALDWSRWGDDQHYNRVTRKRLLKVIPFPANYGYCLYQRKARLFYLQHGLQHLSSEQAAKRAAARAYKALSEQLGSNSWMFGSKGPSSLDCIVFGHLMDALREPIGSVVLHKHSNLVAFCQRLQTDWFDKPSESILRTCSVGGPPNVFVEGEGFNAVYGEKPLDLASSWGLSEQQDKAADQTLSEKEREFQEGSRNAVLLAGGIVVSYLFFANVISFETDEGSVDDEEGDE